MRSWPREIIAVRPGGSADGYDGRGVCYLEFGDEGVAVVDVTFVAGQAPFGFLDGPSIELTRAKVSVRHHADQALVRTGTGDDPGDPGRSIPQSWVFVFNASWAASQSQSPSWPGSRRQ